MKKFVVKDTELIKITAQTKLKVGDTVKCKTPHAWKETDPTITTTITHMKGEFNSTNHIMIKIPEYSDYFDIGYVTEIVED